MSQPQEPSVPLRFPPLVAPATVVDAPRESFDAVVVGAGVAGLAFVLSSPPELRVALLTKGKLGESNTRWAQGGISAAIGEDDSIELHEQDTLAAGAGLCDPETVRTLVAGAPEAVDWLLALGARFDREPGTGKLELGREAAHSRRRVLHAGGDATGAEVERTLVAAVRQRAAVRIVEDAFAIDLLLGAEGDCAGVLAETDGRVVRLEAPVTVIAAGGAGQLWATTSNPPAATADGLAMALRAGVAVADLEFVQFHPTVLALAGNAPFLVSEAVRGEGAYLRGPDGERFMLDEHPLAELAPRDVVARGIQKQLQQHGPGAATLDLRHLNADAMRARFPTIARELAARGLDLVRDLLPIEPAAHYFMGGIVASATGQTALPGLLALGEASCTGVHGANRLASNSLLEGLVFGRAAAHAVADRGLGRQARAPEIDLSGWSGDGRDTSPTEADLQRVRGEIQRIMSRRVSVVRDADGLRTALDTLRSLLRALPVPARSRYEYEIANLAQGAIAITTAALLREESRGAHFRADFPETEPALDGLHYVHATGTHQGWRLMSLAEALPAASRVEVTR